MMSFFSMLKLVPRWAYGLLGVLAILVRLTYWHNSLVDTAVSKERGRLEAVHADMQAKAQAKADEQTKTNAATTAHLDTNYFKEFQNANKTADYWRNRAMSERVPNCTATANNATHSTSGGMGDDTTTAAIDNRPLDLPSTAIIELSTIAGQMRAQVEYLQGKVRADVRTVNGE